MKMVSKRRIAGLCLVVTGYTSGMLASAAHAADSAAAGLVVARNFCSSCHDVTGGARRTTAPGEAPPFAMIAQSSRYTAKSLRSYLQRPHGKMDDVALTAGSIEDVVDYILSQRGR